MGVKGMSLAVAIPHPREAPSRATTATPIRSNLLSVAEVFMNTIKDSSESQKVDSQTEI
jgi:hypothetical protein